MTTIHAYKDTGHQCFFNASLDNGDRIFVSVARTGLLVNKMKWAGIKKERELFRCDTYSLAAMLANLSDGQLPSNADRPLKLLFAVVDRCKSAAEVTETFTALKANSEG